MLEHKADRLHYRAGRPQTALGLVAGHVRRPLGGQSSASSASPRASSLQNTSVQLSLSCLLPPEQSCATRGSQAGIPVLAVCALCCWRCTRASDWSAGWLFSVPENMKLGFMQRCEAANAPAALHGRVDDRPSSWAAQGPARGDHQRFLTTQRGEHGTSKGAFCLEACRTTVNVARVASSWTDFDSVGMESVPSAYIRLLDSQCDLSSTRW
jgi:hypothetical protein